MKIVITGALGHIGSRLIRDLPSYFPEAEVVLIDNFLTQRYCSLFNLPQGGHYRFIEADVLKDDLDNVLDGAAVVIHLAAITDAANSFNNANEVELVNFEGTCRMAQLCAKHGAALVFLSTTSVYGTQDALVDETCMTEQLKPQSPYGESKLRAEQHLTDFATRSNLRFVTLRFGTIFGVSPGMRFHTAVNKFIWQAVFRKPITVWKTALDQNRPYLDLSDAVRALCFLISRNHFDNQIYNVLTLNASVRQIVEAIRSEIPDLEVELVDSKIMNQLSYNVACDKFKKLGFEFKGSLPLSVKESISWLRTAAGR